MAKWVKTSTVIKASGNKTIRYESSQTPNKIESRREAIPHANRSGVWFRTTYFLIRPDGTEKEYYTLKAAKEAAVMEVEK